MKSYVQSCLAVLALLVFAVSPALADGVITAGPVSIGLNDEGNLIDDATATGIFYAGVGDGISPGCFCEGWGYSATIVSSGAMHTAAAGKSIDPFGVRNFTVDGAVYGPSTAFLTGHMTDLPGLSIVHDWSPATVTATGALFEVKVTITNMTGETLTDLRYKRVMDWDIPPTVFSEAITHRGVPGALGVALERSHDDGFDSADPLVADSPINPETLNVDFEDNNPDDDHGSLFLFNFGDLADGETREFSIFYGAAGSEAEADSFVAALALELVSYGQPDEDPTGGTPATYIFGFTGVGRPIAIPEPASLTLLALGGLGMLGYRLRRRK
jgi:type IV pilus assembly protein PilY1